MVAAILISVVATGAIVAVSGPETCPAPSQVSAELDALLQQEGRNGRDYVAHVTPAGAAVRVDVDTGDGMRLGERELPRDGSCQDRARAAAVIIAAWLGLFEAEAPAPRAREQMGPTEASPPAGTPRVTATARDRVNPLPTAAPAATRLWATIGLLGSRAAGDTAGGAELAATAFRAGMPWAARLGLDGTTGHALAAGLQPGAALWRRFAMKVGPAWIGDRAGWRAEAHVAVAAAILNVRGTGFETNHAFNSFGLGGAAGGRLARRWGTAGPFVGIEGLYFPGHRRLFIDGSSGTAEVPRAELLVSVGFSVNGGP